MYGVFGCRCCWGWGSFVIGLQRAARNLVLGNGMEEEVTLTPIIRDEQRTRIEALSRKGIAEGASFYSMEEHVEACSAEGIFPWSYGI